MLYGATATENEESGVVAAAHELAKVAHTQRQFTDTGIICPLQKHMWRAVVRRSTVRLKMIGNEMIKNVGESESCMVCNYRLSSNAPVGLVLRVYISGCNSYYSYDSSSDTYRDRVPRFRVLKKRWTAPPFSNQLKTQRHFSHAHACFLNTVLNTQYSLMTQKLQHIRKGAYIPSR
eukprot:COSAG05_NODE_6819_length_897_cov_1.283208_1_plen_176_part_00